MIKKEMVSLNKIEEFLNIEIGDKVLRNGRIYNEKNRYYWYRNEYYIVNIGEDKWVIVTSNDTTRELLDDYIWYYSNGYSISFEVKGNTRTTINMHRKLMHMDNNPLFVDHVKRNKFDNRLENLRIVTAEDNMRNKSKQKNNLSGITGVYKLTTQDKDFWVSQIRDNDNKQITKRFSITKLGELEAKRQAIEQRLVWKIQFNYLGE